MTKNIFTLFIIFWITSVNAQFQKPYFNTLSIQEGLPEANIQSYLEDNNGYLWFGTQNGLVRYDGYQIKNYNFFDKNKVRLQSPSITKIYQDKKDNIWVFTISSGMYYYEKQTDTFINFTIDNKIYDTTSETFVLDIVDGIEEDNLFILLYSYKKEKLQLLKINTKNHAIVEYTFNSKDKNKIPIKNPVSLFKDKTNRIIIAGDDKLCFYEATSKTFKVAFKLPESMKNTQIIKFVIDPLDPSILWMNTFNGDYIKENGNLELLGKNFIKYNLKTKEYKIFSLEKDNPKTIESNCLDIVIDSQNHLWFASKNGISLYNGKSNTFKFYPIPVNSDLKEIITTIESDKKGNVWVGGNFDELYNFNLNSKKINTISPNNEEGSLPSFNYVSKIFFDTKGTLWVNMPYFGIANLNIKKSIFATQAVYEALIKKQNNDTKLNFNVIGTKDETSFFITKTINLYVWNSITNEFTEIKFRSETNKLKISKAICGLDGTIWIATSDGLYHYNPKTKSSKHYKNDPNDPLTISSNNINYLTLDETNGTLWIVTNNKGISSLNIKSDLITQYPFKKNIQYKKSDNALDDDRVLSILVDTDNVVWIGTNNGSLNRYNPKTKQFKTYGDNDGVLYCVISIFEDSKKRLWVGTYLSGLYLFDRKTEQYIRYNEENGMLDNSIFAIEEDKEGNIWCVSERGFSRLNPETKKINHFSKFNKDLKGIRFTNIFKNQDSTFFVDVKNGMMIFNPSDLQPNPIAPSVVIESIEFKKNSINATLDTIVYPSKNQTITLKYNENKITFNYVALQFDDSENNQYAYQLVGYDKNWINAGTEQKTTYTNLSPGTYIFKVKASNSDGIWNDKGASVKIEILPPWWFTWWAYFLYAILIVGSIWFYIQLRSKALRRENLLLEEKVSHRTNQLEKSIENLKETQKQLIQSEKMASLGELTAGIAHEIQNPLNFVNNFSEVSSELLDEMNTELDKGDIEEAKALANDVKQNLEKINHHGKRADAIVKGMLQHSRSSSGIKEPTDLNALCDEYLRLSYHGLRAKDKSFNATIKTDFDENIGKINIIPQDFGRVILNLLTNAFYVVDEKKKSRIEGYEPTVSISTKKENDKIIIQVSDNGNGMPKEIMEKIFQPFFTTKPTGKGTGLGLSMSYDIVTKGHGGELKVASVENEGTTFFITIIN